jgi:hypothetical protein
MVVAVTVGGVITIANYLISRLAANQFAQTPFVDRATSIIYEGCSMSQVPYVIKLNEK